MMLKVKIFQMSQNSIKRIFSKKWLLIAFFSFITLGVISYLLIKNQLTTHHAEDKVIFIPTGSSYDDVLKILADSKIIASDSKYNNNFLIHELSSLMNYVDRTIKPGRFLIKKGVTTFDLIRKLRAGSQDPIRVTINSKRFIHDVAGELAKNIESDSATIINYWLSDKGLKEVQATPDDLMTYFLPDTYEIYWTETPAKFLKRMKKAHQQFWTDERIALAKAQGLTPKEAYTLASIVDAETNVSTEMKTVAGLYLNRLNIGMRLQADPTAVFGAKAFDDNRVYHNITTHESPFNTYLNNGLPPGPILMPSKFCIESTIEPEQHSYFFMCAKPGYNKGHNFAETNAEHIRNASIYRTWLSAESIQ